MISILLNWIELTFDKNKEHRNFIKRYVLIDLVFVRTNPSNFWTLNNGL